MTDDEMKSLNIADIMQLLPHRYPFLLVDRIERIQGGDAAVGIKNVTINEPFFVGHFPGSPIMPGVLIIEGLAQTAGAITAAHEGGSGAPKLVYFMTIDRAKFRKPVLPGDVLEYHVTKSRSRGSIFKFDCVAMVAGQKVAEAEVSAMMRDAEPAESA
ncbi:MAG: 3-hydroxyacyl-ACP dehydratase FabZ [Pseudomonadota bacterium]